MNVLQMMTTLLQLLFDSDFKRAFTVIMLKHYGRLMVELSVKPTQAVMPLEMITVQLFNDEVRFSALPGCSSPVYISFIFLFLACYSDFALALNSRSTWIQLNASAHN